MRERGGGAETEKTAGIDSVADVRYSAETTVTGNPG